MRLTWENRVKFLKKSENLEKLSKIIFLQSKHGIEMIYKVLCCFIQPNDV